MESNGRGSGPTGLKRKGANGMIPRGESRPKVDKGKSLEGIRAEPRAGGQGNMMGDAWGRGAKGLARLDRGVVANKCQGTYGGTNHSGGEHELVRSKGKSSDVVARCE